jgi:purine-binding chemotaxis protein CheW
MSSSATERHGLDEGRTEYLTFFIQGEEYAVGLRRVREVIPYDTVTRVPQMPPALRGVTNVRGQVVPVLDLSTKFHGADTPIDKRTCIVLVEAVYESAPTVVGLMTEAVGQVLALSADEIAPPPSFGAPVKTELLAGMGRVGKKFALLLDIDRLLDGSELVEPETPADGSGEMSIDAEPADTTADGEPVA